MIGNTILHYKITEKLGEGGMGVVYKAIDSELDRVVALKFLPRHLGINEDNLNRFKTEAKAAATLNHPNITTIYSIEKSEEADKENLVFIVMEYIDGIELKEKIKRGSLSIEQALNISIKICEGLEAAHKKGVIHRDIKSSNIMVTEEDNVKIMDFGFAKLNMNNNLTSIGTTLGTIAYMSPEQTTGENVDHQTDIWSVGIVLYELITGQLPFKGDYDQAIIYSIMNEDPPKLNHHIKENPELLESIIFKALAKKKEDRYQSVAELKNDLKLLNETSESELKEITKQFSFIKQSNDDKVRLNQGSRYLKIISVFLIVIAASFLTYNFIPGVRSFFNVKVNSVLLPETKHIAILPFNLIGSGTGNSDIAEGLTEIITSKLSQLEQYQEKLWIVPSSELQKNKVANPTDALMSFGINLAITGSLQRLNDKWQLILNLVNPSEKRQISSRVIDEPLNGISTIQDEAVVQAAEMLGLHIEETVQNNLKSGETSNPEANNLYLQAKGNLLHFENTANLNSALNLFNKAIKEDSSYALAYAGLGEACLRKYSKTKDALWIAKAQENCSTAIKLNENFAKVHITLGLLYTETGKYEEANKEFLKAEDIDPSDVDAYQGQASAYNKQGKLDEAESIYKKVIKLRPDYWLGYTHLGIFYYLQGKYKEAAQQFEEVIKLTPQNAGAYRNLGAMYYYLDQKADAIVMFKRSLEIEPDYSTYSNLATLYYYEGLYNDAASMYEKALKMQDTDYSVWGYLAGAYRQSLSDSSKINFALRKAKSIAEKQLKVNPVDPLTLINIASYCTELNLPDSAYTLVKKVETLHPSDVNVMILIGEVYEQLGKRDQALLWIKKSIENGYSTDELQHIPEFKKLREDEHFKKLIATNK
jgi:serine/threonine protein kinase/Tfp pilus assembly protein PilF